MLESGLVEVVLKLSVGSATGEGLNPGAWLLVRQMPTRHSDTPEDLVELILVRWESHELAREESPESALALPSGRRGSANRSLRFAWC